MDATQVALWTLAGGVIVNAIAYFFRTPNESIKALESRLTAIETTSSILQRHDYAIETLTKAVEKLDDAFERFTERIERVLESRGNHRG